MVPRSFNHPPRPSAPLYPPLQPLNIYIYIYLARFNFAIHLGANHPSFETQWPSFLLLVNREIRGMNFEKRRLRYTFVTSLRALLGTSLLNNIWYRKRYPPFLFHGITIINWKFRAIDRGILKTFSNRPMNQWDTIPAKFSRWRVRLKWIYRMASRQPFRTVNYATLFAILLNKIYFHAQIRYDTSWNYVSWNAESISRVACRLIQQLTSLQTRERDDFSVPKFPFRFYRWIPNIEENE